MGGTGSVFLQADSGADEKTVRAFQEFENECISRNLRANDIYDLLNQKYDYLLGQEVEHKIKQLESKVEKAQQSTTTSKQPSKNAKDVPAEGSLRKSKSHVGGTLQQHQLQPRIYHVPQKSSLHAGSNNGVSSEPSSMHTPAPIPHYQLPHNSGRIVSANNSRRLASHHENSPSAPNSAHRRNNELPPINQQQHVPQSSRKPPVPRAPVVGKTFGTLSTPVLRPLKTTTKNSTSSAMQGSASSSALPPLVTQASVERSSSSDSLTVAEEFAMLGDAEEDTDDESDPQRAHVGNRLRSHSLDDEEEEYDDNEEGNRTVLGHIKSVEELEKQKALPPIKDVDLSRRRTSTFEQPVVPHFECKLCQKKFGNAELLETHIAFSQMHKSNVQCVRDRYSKALEDADNLGLLLKKTTERFQHALELKRSYNDGKISQERMRWQRAIGKVISHFTAQKIEKIMQDLHASEMSTGVPGTLSSDIDSRFSSPGVLMFTSSRFFWRTRSRFTVHVFYHQHCHTLEILSILHLDTPIASPTNAGSNAGVHRNITKLAPRIFLDMNRLEAQYLKHQKIVAKEQEQHGGVDINPIMMAEDEGITRALRIVREVVQALKIDYVSVQQQVKTPQDALYIDVQAISFYGGHYGAGNQPILSTVSEDQLDENDTVAGVLKAQSSSSSTLLSGLDTPLLEQKPKGLILTPADPYRKSIAPLLLQTETVIQTKIDEVLRAQNDLSSAVERAEHYSTKVQQSLQAPNTVASVARKFLSPLKEPNAISASSNHQRTGIMALSPTALSMLRSPLSKKGSFRGFGF